MLIYPLIAPDAINANANLSRCSARLAMGIVTCAQFATERDAVSTIAIFALNATKGASFVNLSGQSSPIEQDVQL